MIAKFHGKGGPTVYINTSLSSEMTLIDVDVIRGALYNEQHFVNYDVSWLFLIVAQIVLMHGHAMSYFNRHRIAPCISTIKSSWLIDASCYFCASRVSTLTSTGCTLLYVRPSKTFSGGRCNVCDS